MKNIDRCEMGTLLPKNGGPCPRCGARSDQNCGPWITSIEAERDRLQARVEELETALGRAAILADNHGDPELRDAILALPLEEKDGE